MRHATLPPVNTDPRSRAPEFVSLLLQWYEHKKRALPWRETSDPYAIHVSETMLQQTQVATVIPFYQKWMARFPTAAALAAASVDDVLAAWQGLGYYSRARNLHRAAQVIVDTHGGVFPARFADVLALPGVGPYTAGAICSIALGQDAPIVDANVVRVLCRVFGITGDPKATETQRTLWSLAERLIPPSNAATFNQAMMELGALVCGTPPKCDACPVQTVCYAYGTGNPSALPAFAPRPAFTAQTDVCAAIEDAAGRLLLIQRPLDAGLWAGLWELPRVTAAENETAADAAARAAREVAGFAGAVPTDETPVARVRHGVTTRKITLLALPVSGVGEPKPSGVWAWATPEEALERFALASPQRRLLEQIEAGRAAAVVQGRLF